MDHPTHPRAEPIPGYRLIERLGRGGFGEVWKAEAPGGMHKAIKFVFGDADAFGDGGQAADQEYKSLSRVKTIRHPFVLSIERFEVIDGQLIIVMELADRNLWDRFNECVRHGLPGVPRAELLRYMEEAAEALDLMNLHHQIQHLDVKPQNIFLVHQHVKVADFGLAKDLEGTRADLTGGVTPTYAPPETFEGWVSRQSDQYSLAIVFMEMLTGRRPFSGTTTRQLVLQHLTAVPDLAALSPTDRSAVGRALAKSPDERFPTCGDFVRALRTADPYPPVPVTAIPDLHPGMPSGPLGGDPPAGYTRTSPATMRRLVPALVTPKSKSVAVSSAAYHRSNRPAATEPSVPPRPVERTGDGLLQPALIVGVGGFGREAVRRMRQLVADRHGVNTLPHLRWLYLDTDPVGAEAAAAGPETAALAPGEVVITRLRRPTHYLTRDGLPPVDTWLPPEDLFRIPRTPATEGVRGLGRLALCDHYHSVCHRVRVALERLITDEAVELADRHTSLGIRSTFPRVYLATSLVGGTGSGMFLDLAYLIRRVASQLGFGSPPVVGILAVPTVDPQVWDARALGNASAALRELYHFSRPGGGYAAQFDTREAPWAVSDGPFHRSVLVPLVARTLGDRFGRGVDVAAHCVVGELLTPLGRVAYPDGGAKSAARHVVIGVRHLIWPRNGVVRAGARLVVRRTLLQWCRKAGDEPIPAAAAAVDSIWVDRLLDREEVQKQLEMHLSDALSRAPADVVEHLLRPLATQPSPGISPATQARLALKGMVELMGRPGPDDADVPYEIGRLLTALVRDVTVQADTRIMTGIVRLVEQPGLRLAGAEDALAHLRSRLNRELGLANREAAALEDQANAQFHVLHHQFLAPSAGPGPASGRSSEESAASLRAWAQVRTQALLKRACASFYRVLVGNLPEYARELATVRSGLGALLSQLDAMTPEPGADDAVQRPIFPNGDVSVTRAAERLLAGWTFDDFRAFEEALEVRLKCDGRGLRAVCTNPAAGGTEFLAVMMDQASRFLDARTPRLTAPQVLEAQSGRMEDLRARLAELVGTSAPAGFKPRSVIPPTRTVLGIPADDSAHRLTEIVRNLCHGSEFRTATTDGDIVLYQEANISFGDLPQLNEERTERSDPQDARPTMSHSRTDINWVSVGPM